jgi:hypothetical protein
LLPPAAELDSATAATPTLSVVKTVSDNNLVLAGYATCATSVDTAFAITDRPTVWDYRAVKKEVPNGVGVGP